MNRLIGVLLFHLGSLLLLSAQNTIKLGENFYKGDEVGVVFSEEISADFIWHTNGYAFNMNFANIKNYSLANYYFIGLGQLKHPKEFRQNFEFAPATTGRLTKAFVFGKDNTLFALRGGMGQKRYFSEKEKQKGAAIGLNYSGGVTLGLLKPYYLDLMYFKENTYGEVIIKSEVYNETNADLFLSTDRVYGASSFLKGIGQTKVVPGINAQVGIHMAWGAFEAFIKALEVGIMMDYFFGRVPIMVEDPRLDYPENKNYFINLYVNLELGKRK
jgi:hypothetical protein